MAVVLNTLSSVLTSSISNTWGFTVIGKELFVGAYGSSITSISVYDADTYALKRTLTTTSFGYGIGTDGTDLYIKDTSAKIVKVDKNTGSTISTTTLTFAMGSSASFRIDLANDRIYVADYNTALNILKYSDGTLIKSYTFPSTYVSGVEVINNKYVVVSSYSSNKAYISSMANNDVTTLSFTEIYSGATNKIVGVGYYSGKLFFTTYSTSIQAGTLTGLVFSTTKYLLQKTNENNISYSLVNGISSANLIPTMTSNTAPSGVASASTINGATWEAWKAFDKTVGLWSAISGTTTGWLAYQFSAPKVINKYTLVDGGDVKRCPKDWTFEGSNNGTNWTILHTVKNETSWTLNVKNEYVIDNNYTYTYYRINITANNGHASFLQIGEFEMMEVTKNELIKLQGTPTESLYLAQGFDDPTLINNTYSNEKVSGIKDSDTATGQIFKVDIPSNMTSVTGLTLG